LGLIARTRILQVLEKQALSIRDISNVSRLNYNIVVHHLRLLKNERVVVRKGDKRPFAWELTGVGQQRLVNLKEQ